MSKHRILAILVFVAILFQQAVPVPSQSRPAENKLAALAASMKPGTFALLNADGDDSGYGKALLSTGGSNGITGYASKMAYDAATDRVYFSGGEHGGKTITIHYDIARNKWVDDGVITAGKWGHAYDSNAIIPGTHELFANSKLVIDLRRLNLDTNTWSVPAQPNVRFYETEPSVEYFPERDELLWLQGGYLGGLAAYKRSTDKWTVVSRNLSALQLRGAVARYIPSQAAVLLMGGVDTAPMYPAPDKPSHAVYKYNRNGTVTRLKDFPDSIWMYTNHFVAAVDPVSSELIVINSVLKGSYVYESGNPNPFTDAVELWRYTPAADTWTKMDSSILPDPAKWWQPTNTSNNTGGFPFGVTTVSIPKYGIIMLTSEAYEWPGRQSRVYLYKHSTMTAAATPSASTTATPSASATATPSASATAASAGPPAAGGSPSVQNPASSSPFLQKCAETGVLGCYGFDSAQNVRNFPADQPYPLKYGGWAGTGPCQSAGLREHPYTRKRAANELNVVVRAQHGVCYYPVIDNTTFASGSGSLRIEVPSQADSNNGGYFDSTFQGLDKPHLRVGPDNGGDIWQQFQYRTHNMASNSFNGADSKGATKTVIFGTVPPGLDWLGSDITLSSTFVYGTGWNGNRNGLFQSYTYGSSGYLEPTERRLGNTIYLQTGTKCAYNDAGPYSYPPCVRLVDDKWLEITRHLKLQPVANDFAVSGDTLSRTRTFNPGMVGRYIYIAGDNYYRISAFIDAGSVKLNSQPQAGAKKTVFISNYPNSVIQEWVDGVLVINNSDQRMSWDMPDAGWGQFRLQPHMTNKNPAIVHTPGAVWYDDFIVSSKPIAMVSRGDERSLR